MKGENMAGQSALTDGGEQSLTLLDRYPATLAGHVGFLELVRDEILLSAEAKRHQFAKGYSNDTLARMVQGIKWAEAARRITQLSNLQGDAVEQVASVLRRELSVGTVVHIAELLEPAVRRLRDELENARSVAPRPLNAESTTVAVADVSERSDWLSEIAWNVHEIVHYCERNLELFREMVRQWGGEFSQFLEENPRMEGEGDSLRWRDNDAHLYGIGPLQIGRITLEAKHAVLAAIYDCYRDDVMERCMEPVEAINPWQNQEIPQNVEDRKAANSYITLVREKVPGLREENSGTLKEWLADVSAEMKPTGDIGTKANQTEGEKDLPKIPAAELQKVHRKAWLSFQYAEAKNGKRLEDRDAFDWLEEYGIEPTEEESELTDYKLPAFDTWARYLRYARKANGEQKYTPRHALRRDRRGTRSVSQQGTQKVSGSIVRSDEIDSQKVTEGNGD